MATAALAAPGSSKRSSDGLAEHPSPVRKRQRTSPVSSDSEEFWDELDSDGLAALDAIEQHHTQQTTSNRDQSPLNDVSVSAPVAAGSAAAPAAEASTSATITLGFVRPSLPAAAIPRSPSPEHDAPENKDFSSWFADTTDNSAALSTSTEISSFAFVPGRTWSVSAAALEKAAAKWKSWEQEDDKDDEPSASTTNILKPISNMFSRPSTPKPAAVPAPLPVAAVSSRARALSAAPAIRTSIPPAPVTPVRPPLSTGSTSRGVPRPIAVASASKAVFSSPRLGMTPRAQALAARPKFVTPFINPPATQPRQGTASSTPLSTKSAFARCTTYPPATRRPSVPAAAKPGKQQPSPPTSPAPGRPTLVDSSLRPGQWTQDELEDLGIPSFIFQITPRSAPYYAFARSASEPESNAANALGSSAALEQLLKDGCQHATKQWVDNHWSLVLWKLAGMVLNDPEPYDALIKKWRWTEVLQQLHHRYKREFVDGARPALRAVLERDANASAPMVLCVSAISWTERKKLEDGTFSEPCVELELTDGWYFVRAQVDEAMTRGIKRNMLKVGRKLSCQGAKLEPSHADGKDVWSAYDNTVLVLTGNSSALAPWYAKLGFHPQGFTAGLRSLTPDGGPVALVDIVIVKAYPAGFIEYHADGTKDGPRNEEEEREIQAQWQRKREREMERLRMELEKRMFEAEAMLEKLKRIAGNGFSPGEDDEMPDHIEDLYEEVSGDLNPGARLKTVSARDAGWMAIFLHEKTERDRQQGAYDMESELASACPERNVRSFRVLRVRDAQTLRRPTTRTAQLTVWDAAQLGKDVLVEGARFQITNVAPTQQRSWGGPSEANAEIFLNTRKNSRFRKMSTKEL
ncbi:hypothetical protein EXIGLDRAFT_833637 [Exidia glandulosa HHB12029]|uniref:BRCA2 OB1 domain-containing protein n=1 Tax=Exidia glandulosa HHB12029 TaxID=1314781 RepID=A0A165KIN9_EXIGL|nr:hypothetical protein EXIGLDRAFT_833637 [Exidia glandulosa HHB12029]